MTSKPLITVVASVAAMAAVLWSMPAAAGMDSADANVHFAHDKWPGVQAQATGVPEAGTVAVLALGLGGVGLGSRRRGTRS